MNLPKKIVLAGGSGCLGRRLAASLTRLGSEVTILTRDPAAWSGDGTPRFWDGRTPGAWVSALDGTDALVNLTGKNVNCRPTRRNARDILSSRVDSVAALGMALRSVRRPPRIWVQASSLAVYGDAGDRICEESARISEAFPASVCIAWEAALGEALLPGMRPAILRIGFVLDTEGGALPFLTRLAKYGLGGSIGNGRQWISWLHHEDMLGIFLRALGDDHFPAICNATSPHPETNRAFMTALREALGRPWSPPAPAAAVHLGCWLLGSDPRIALTGRRCLPAALGTAGFDFQFPRLHDALANLIPQT